MNVAVTGGAGFIGSHLVDALIEAGHRVRVIDDLATGLASNLNPRADFVKASITDAGVVREFLDGVEIAFHQAALGSVPRSVETPLDTDHVNVHGTLTVLESARRVGVRRVVLASSSSVYGGETPLPTREDHGVFPKSPYAVSKVAAEHYGRVFSSLLGVEVVCLRYFNVYGPRQRADSPYAAAIPLFIDALQNGLRPVVHGDGLQTRDFTFVSDAVAANLLAAMAPAERCDGRTYNVAGGRPHTVLEIVETLGAILGAESTPEFAPARAGDVRQSHADISAARADLGYEPKVSLEDGLRQVVTPAHG